jgi:hypothetical protein
MKVKGEQVESRFFSIAFGIMITSIGLTWFLQIIGVLPEGIKVLQYACPICVILFGVRILTAHIVKGSNMKQGIMEDYNGKM